MSPDIGVFDHRLGIDIVHRYRKATGSRHAGLGGRDIGAALTRTTRATGTVGTTG